MYANYYFLWIFSAPLASMFERRWSSLGNLHPPPYWSSTVIFHDHENTISNPLGDSLYFVAFVYGWGSLATAFAAAYGCTCKKSNFVLAVAIWRTFCLVSSVIIYGYVIGWNTFGLGFWLNSLICLVLLVLDTWIMFSMWKIYLMVFSWEHFQRGVTLVMDIAQHLALEHGHGHCDTVHILAGLTNQHGVHEFLRAGKVDPDHFEKKISHELSEVHSAERRPVGLHVAPFTHDAHHALHHALISQDDQEDKKLRLEHVILALFHHRHVHGIDLDQEGCMKELHKRKEEESPATKPKAPKILGCLPLEETVFVYICLEVIWCCISIISVLFFGVSGTYILGLKTTSGMRVLELFVSLIGLGLGISWGLTSIWRHRMARFKIQRASAHHVGKHHAQELDVTEAAHLLHGEPKTAHWVGTMRKCSARLSVYLVFDVMRVFIVMPMALMALVVGNVCDSYVHGVANISVATRFFSNEIPMHCTLGDWEILFWVSVVGVLDVYIVWSILCLWHEYAFGWTTTDIENGMYIDPMDVNPYKFVWLAGGVPEGSALLKGHPELEPPKRGTMKSHTKGQKGRRARKEPAGEHFMGALKAAIHHRPTVEETYDKFRRELVFAL
jgi:hypothetical protein